MEDTDSSLLASEVNLNRVLVGKIIDQRIINKQAMRDIVMHSWKFLDSLEVEDLGNNAFLFSFPDQVI